ncbi:adhesion G-protein coupled receptor G7 isoform X1 [Pseudophryne corroboree]|uniref:adhesion G-protein coupled receptor G7 isoform X1 n=1 Tax=Pseudophryne corroboree TaxID=495146 RepID=UPI003081C738
MEISHMDTDNIISNDSENEVFLTDLEMRNNEGMCTALAALQHYFLLTTFVFTTMLGAEFCIRFIWFTPSLPEHFMKSALSIGWGLPALIVLITIAATLPGTNGYNRKEFCWLVAENEKKQLDPAKPMLLSFLLPVGIILLANICIVLAVAVLVIWKKNPKIKSTRRISLLKNTLATFSVASLLGVTWVFGYLTLLDTDDNAHIIFSFIFCICGSTQGLQIFIFYTLRDRRFLEKIAAAIRLFNKCKIYMNSQKYWVNRMQHKKSKRHLEKFRHFSDSDELISG